MATMETLEVQRDGWALTVTLNRPDAHNAMSHRMVEELIAVFEGIRDDREVRAVVIAAAGKTFCAGGDIRDMQADLTLSHDERKAIMARFDHMLNLINTAPQVTIARVQGAAMGGGFGLVCASDIAVASEGATFGLPEVRLGVAPALISPYVIARIGLTRARQLMLTGARFDANAALTYGLVQAVCPPDGLDDAMGGFLREVRECSPHALAETKALIFHVLARPVAESLDYRADLITRLRASEDGQEGMMAFVQKRKPRWAADSDS